MDILSLPAEQDQTYHQPFQFDEDTPVSLNDGNGLRRSQNRIDSSAISHKLGESGDLVHDLPNFNQRGSKNSEYSQQSYQQSFSPSYASPQQTQFYSPYQSQSSYYSQNTYPSSQYQPHLSSSAPAPSYFMPPPPASVQPNPGTFSPSLHSSITGLHTNPTNIPPRTTSLPGSSSDVIPVFPGSPIIAKYSDTSVPHPLEFDDPSIVTNPMPLSQFYSATHANPVPHSVEFYNIPTTAAADPYPPRDQEEHHIAHHHYRSFSYSEPPPSFNTTIPRQTSPSPPPTPTGAFSDPDDQPPKEKFSALIYLPRANSDQSAKNALSSSETPEHKEETPEETLQRGRSTSMIPTKRDIQTDWKGAGVGVGIGVGCAVGLVVGGVIGLVVLGGVGAAVGRAVGKRRGQQKMRSYLSTQDLSNIKRFPKSLKAKAPRCHECAKKFGPFVKRGHCGLCGQSYCQIHVPKRAYALFEGEDLLKCTKVCMACWHTNMPEDDGASSTAYLPATPVEMGPR